MEENKIAIFEGKQIRKTIFNNEWWFVVEDIVLALIESNDPKQYIQRMKLRDPELAKGYVQLVHTLPIKTSGGSQKMVCSNTEGIFGERVTTEISANEKPLTFDKSKQVATRGGNVAGQARKHTEKELGHTIISRANYLKSPKSQKRLK